MKLQITNKVKQLTGSRKREFSFYVKESDTPENTASYWDGGSKTIYDVLNVVTGARGFPPAGSYPTFKAEYTLKPCEILIETGFFVGKPATPAITCRKEDEDRVRSFLGIHTAIAA